jgi:hypothetical protein
MILREDRNDILEEKHAEQEETLGIRAVLRICHISLIISYSELPTIICNCPIAPGNNTPDSTPPPPDTSRHTVDLAKPFWIACDHGAPPLSNSAQVLEERAQELRSGWVSMRL